VDGDRDLRGRPETGDVEVVVQDERISWPDSCALGPDRRLHFTTAQIPHGASSPGPYRIFLVVSAGRIPGFGLRIPLGLDRTVSSYLPFKVADPQRRVPREVRGPGRAGPPKLFGEGERAMKRLHTVIGMLLGGLLVVTLGARSVSHVEAQHEHPSVVVGTFDSRAVAVAYIRSDRFGDRLGDLRAELERAKAAGDDERVAEIEAQGQAMQRKAHEQGFGSAPVDDILERIEDELPVIAAETGVNVIVSKWVLAWHSPAAGFVDVTDRLVEEFEPDAETLKVIEELLEHEPVPLDELDHEH
jgi:hypothetical protein